MEIRVFKALAKIMSPKVAFRVRGRHGIGKSQVVYQIGKELGLEVVERRLSQLTEGDLVGLPEFEGSGKTRSTEFRPLTWLVDCVNNPRILFLDELNRALPAVEQATFQIADSRKFSGLELHPETRIFVAENIGDQYQVQSSDPAAISRYAIIDLDPSVEEWLEWASDNCHPATVEFIRANPRALESLKLPENNKKYPDRRAWHKLDAELQRSGLMDTPEHELFYAMALSMIGVEFASAYTKFCSEREQQVSAKDIITDWLKAKKRLGRETNEKYVDCIGKLSDYLKQNLLTDQQAEEYAKFMHSAPAEPRMSAWAALNHQADNLFKVHPKVEALMVETTLSQSEQQEKEELEKSKKKK